MPKSPKPVPKKKSKKKPKKISKTKPKKKRAVKKSKSSIRKKSATIKKSTAKKKHETKKSSEKLISTGKPLVDEHFELCKSHEVYCENSVYDAMLNMRNAEKNIDKFYILQVLKSAKGFVFHTRWGRTGTKGQVKTLGPFKDHKLAVKQFEKKFKAKTGASWLAKATLLGKANPNTKKYSVLRMNYAPPSNLVIWQYFVDDGVDGKKDGWYDYSVDGSAEVEKVWQQYQANTSANLGIRHVQTGFWVYEVDFRKMEQTNLGHHARKRRGIRRFIR